MKEEEEAGAGVVFAWIAWNAVRVSRVVKRSLVVMVVNPTVRFNATRFVPNRSFLSYLQSRILLKSIKRGSIETLHFASINMLAHDPLH